MVFSPVSSFTALTAFALAASAAPVVYIAPVFL